jgi:ubiquitin-protein ligase E3 C
LPFISANFFAIDFSLEVHLTLCSQVDIPLAPFFIAKLLGRKNYFDELHGLDPQLHKSLLQIKKYKGNVEDLCLDFTVSSGEVMGSTPLELFPGGAAVNVTNSNRHQYVHLVADYRLNQQIAVQCRHFIHGFSKVRIVRVFQFFFPIEYFLFDLLCLHQATSQFSVNRSRSGRSQRDAAHVQPRGNAGAFFIGPIVFEHFDLSAQTVISGKNAGDWDVDDLVSHAKFEGCTSSSSTVVKLMKVLRDFNPQQRSLFLKFVTSCPRPPLLGFSELQVQKDFLFCSVFLLLLPPSLPSLSIKRSAPPLHLSHSQRTWFFFIRRRRPLAIRFNVLQPVKAATVQKFQG